MDHEVVQAYERYVMAQVWYGDQGLDAVRSEQSKAIESLIPGTLYYYHLYFIDMAKQKVFDQMTTEEASLYEHFKQNYSRTREFLEVETAFHVVHKLQKLPKEIDEQTSNEDVVAFLNLVDYIDDQINDQVFEPQLSRPAYMNTQAMQEGNSDQSEDEEAEGKQLECFDAAKYFNKESLIKEAHDKIKEHCKNIQYTNQYRVNVHDDLTGMQMSKYYRVFNEIDWTLCEPQYVYGQALLLAQRPDDIAGLQLFEITSESFFDQICEYFKRRFEFQNDKAEIQKLQSQRQGHKFQIAECFFNAMTLE